MSKANKSNNVLFMGVGFGVTSLLIMGIANMAGGPDEGTKGTEAQTAPTASVTVASEAPVTAVTEEAKVAETTAPAPEPTVVQLEAPVDTPSHVPMDVEGQLPVFYSNLQPGKFDPANVYFGSQSYITEISPVVAEQIQGTARHITKSNLGNKDPNWDFDTSWRQIKPNIDKACYYMERGYYGCSHVDGLQFVFTTRGELVALVDNGSGLVSNGSEWIERNYGFSKTLVDMEKGTYWAYVDSKLLPYK